MRLARMSTDDKQRRWGERGNGKEIERERERERECNEKRKVFPEIPDLKRND